MKDIVCSNCHEEMPDNYPECKNCRNTNNHKIRLNRLEQAICDAYDAHDALQNRYHTAEEWAESWGKIDKAVYARNMYLAQ